jgi:PilZ domain
MGEPPLFINAELSQLPIGEGRQSQRRIVNIAAALREDGARTLSVVVHDVSLGGFKAEAPEPLEEGVEVWLKLPGCEARRSRVIWAKDKDVGCEFEQPLHQAELDLIVAPTPRRVLRGVFGPNSVRRN